MATLPTNDAQYPLQFRGPLVDNAAPYSGIGMKEFQLIQPIIAPDWNGEFDPLPDSVADRPFWQYGSGSHSSDSREIIGSVLLTLRSNSGTAVSVRHLVIDGSSQWVIGRNIVRKCNLIYDGCNILELPLYTASGDRDFIPLIDEDMHSYIAYEKFISAEHISSDYVDKSFYYATAQLPIGEKLKLSFDKLKPIIDIVHRHVCGHSSYNDIKTLLDRNGIWNEDTKRYLAQTIETCKSCKHTSEPTGMRKVSLSSMSREFNDLVCVDHLFIDRACIFHAMDSASRYSVGTLVPDTSMLQAVTAFEAHWVSQFWAPTKVLFDPGFKGIELTKYLQDVGIARMAVAKGVLELRAGSRRSEPDRAVELAFRASLGRGGGQVVQRRNAQRSIATRDSQAGASRDLRVRSPSKLERNTIHAGVVNPWPSGVRRNAQYRGSTQVDGRCSRVRTRTSAIVNNPHATL